MMQNRAFVLLGLGLFAACGVGDDAAPPHDVTDRMCQALGTVTGTWAQGMADPDLDGDCEADNIGSWDDGVWTFSVAIVSNDCTTAPTPLPSYKFSSIYTIGPSGCTVPTTCTAGVKNPMPSCELSAPVFTYMTDPTVHNHVKTSAGGGIREGNLELFSADGTQVWNLSPVLTAQSTDMTTGTIGGQFEFNIYPTDQWTVMNPP